MVESFYINSITKYYLLHSNERIDDAGDKKHPISHWLWEKMTLIKMKYIVGKFLIFLEN